MGRKARFTQIDNAVFEEWLPVIGHDGLVVYAFICYRSNPKTGSWCNESLPNMVKRLGMRRQRLQAAVRRLIDAGLIERELRRPKPCGYRPIRDRTEGGNQARTGLINQSKSGLNEVGNQSKNDPINQSRIGLQTISNITNTNSDGSAVVNAKELVIEFRRRWVEKYRESYEPTWGKDGRLFKQKLRGIPADEIVAKMDVFFDGWWETHWRSEKGRVRPKISDFTSNLERIPASIEDRALPRAGRPTREL
jgi:hypothetical protein